MRYTLLEMVQMILSAMDSDEVNNITDTVESDQVALLLKGIYYDLSTDLGLPEHEELFQLTASGDNNLPCVMFVPENITKVHWIKYNNEETGDSYPDWQKVTYKPFEEFLDFVQALREETSDVGSQNVTQGSQTFEIMYRTDRHPDFYTTTDDNTYVFDAYDSTEDTTLQASKTMCHGVACPTFTLENSFIPDLDPTQFSYYINRAKVRAFAELKQISHDEAVSTSRGQKIVLQKRQRKTEGEPEINRLPQYGRK